jgi:hypothetical protein
VFINNIGYVKYPEGMPSLLPIPSIIRLNFLNISPDIVMEAFKSSDEFIIPLDEDGENSQCILNDSNRPSDIIQCRTQTMNNFANQEPPRDGILFDKVRLDEIIAAFYVLINGSSVRLTCDERPNFPIEDIKVLLRPVDTSEGISHLLHMLYSLQGDSDVKSKSGKAKDATRIRDTCPEKGRGSRYPKKGGEAHQALNSQPPPEEVESQTAREHHHGGCIAKHTHLGSLEDA